MDAPTAEKPVCCALAILASLANNAGSVARATPRVKRDEGLNSTAARRLGRCLRPDPGRVLKASHPGSLSLRELVGAELCACDGLGAVDATGEEVDCLGVSGSLAGGRADAAGGGESGFGLFKDAACKHRLDASVDAISERLPCDIENHESLLEERTGGRGVRRRKRAACDRGDFERSYDPRGVMGMDAGCRCGVDRGQTGMEVLGAIGGDLGHERCADDRVCGGELGESIPHASEIERCSADKQNGTAPRAAVFDGHGGGLEPRCHTERFGRRNEVEAVVGDGGSIGVRRFCSADIEAPVYGNRVNTHDFRPEPLGQGDAKGRLAGGRRPGEKPAVFPENGADGAGRARGAC